MPRGTKLKWVIVDLNQIKSVKEQRVDGSSAFSKKNGCCKVNIEYRGRALLENIKLYFNGAGGLDKHGELSVKYRVSSIKDISLILNHFDKYPLITQKRADYLLFKKAFEIIQRKEHRTLEGLHKILSIKAVMNLVGFVEGEGCFYIDISETSGKVGARVQLKFKITQHSRDALLMESLVKYLDCGKIYKKSSVDVIDYEVKKLSDITEKVIPFFKKYPLQGSKKLNFDNFCTVASLVESGAHLTKSGLEEIRKIKSGMNTQRKP
ncbi:cytochrome oxidase I intronic ORF 5 [Tuber brumale]|nr:cytochrome oxidase I intronic ORF 5 [Tuber brumale]